MDEVFRMFAMSDGDPFREPGDLDPGQVDGLEEEDELETAGILTSSDDDEVIAEEIIVIAESAAKPKKKKAAAKKAPAKKAAKKVADNHRDRTRSAKPMKPVDSKIRRKSI